jgi:hypothetical protein
LADILPYRTLRNGSWQDRFHHSGDFGTFQPELSDESAESSSCLRDCVQTQILRFLGPMSYKWPSAFSDIISEAGLSVSPGTFAEPFRRNIGSQSDTCPSEMSEMLSEHTLPRFRVPIGNMSFHVFGHCIGSRSLRVTGNMCGKFVSVASEVRQILGLPRVRKCCRDTCFRDFGCPSEICRSVFSDTKSERGHSISQETHSGNFSP